MKNWKIGLVLIVLGLVLIMFLALDYAKDQKLIDNYIETKGTCFLDNGTCLHDSQNSFFSSIKWIVTALIVLIGSYLVFFDKANEKETKSTHNVMTSSKITNKDLKFEAFLEAFDSDKKKVLAFIRSERGITQSTLRFRTGYSKTQLSLILKELEEKGIISRKKEKKTYQIFLKKAF